MKLSKIFPFLLLLVSATTSAQDMVVGPAMAETSTINLYEAPNAAAPLRQVALREAELPLAVEGKQTGFLQVSLGGRQFWVRGVEVRTVRGVTAKCGAIVQTSSTQSAATPGAGNRACK